jgi:hypothetical protein
MGRLFRKILDQTADDPVGAEILRRYENAFTSKHAVTEFEHDVKKRLRHFGEAMDASDTAPQLIFTFSSIKSVSVLRELGLDHPGLKSGSYEFLRSSKGQRFFIDGKGVLNVAGISARRTSVGKGYDWLLLCICVVVHAREGDETRALEDILAHAFRGKFVTVDLG